MFAKDELGHKNKQKLIAVKLVLDFSNKSKPNAARYI